MNFILKIFFSGLIAFVPSEDGKRVTVLLLDAAHAQHATAGFIPEHKPVLLTRAARCTGDCPTSNAEVAQFLFPGSSASAAADALADALEAGAVWKLAGSDLSIGIPQDGVRLVRNECASGKRAPDTAAERADFRWVANIKEMDPAIGSLNQAIFSDQPPGQIVARLELTAGELSTYSVISVDGKAAPVDFFSVSNDKPTYVRAVASWVQAEVSMAAEMVTVAESSFSGTRRRTMSLEPLNGVVEIAVLNTSRPIVSERAEPPEPGTHFERYWDLAAKPPANQNRAIPHPPSRQLTEFKSWDSLHPTGAEKASPLLGRIFRAGRGPFDQILCPMSQYPRP